MFFHNFLAPILNLRLNGFGCFYSPLKSLCLIPANCPALFSFFWHTLFLIISAINCGNQRESAIIGGCGQSRRRILFFQRASKPGPWRANAPASDLRTAKLWISTQAFILLR